MIHALCWLATTAVVIATAFFSPRPARTGPAVIFSASQRGIAIVIPSDSLPAEKRAADLLRVTLAKSSGRSVADFPVYPERAAPKRAIFVGSTRRYAGLLRSAKPAPFDTAVGFAVRGGSVFLRSERRESIQAAAGWFLENHVGARWFMPGPLGENIPRRAELQLPAGEQVERPGFISRDLGLTGTEAAVWHARNRLEPRFDHGHNLASIFTREVYQRHPEMIPWRIGQRQVPWDAGEFQPHLLSEAAVKHAADAAIRVFDRDPKRVSFSLSTNDAIRYDESPETLAVVAPPRFFRHRPDYSDLVFKFTNEVAELVAKKHPDRWLPAYAYYWCENTPRFPVARNVVPFLTADRSQWSYPEFENEDRALIERWCKSGAEIVGVYDYFYGNPFLSPRPTLYAVKQSIPFEYRAGVRAFYAETYSNWALDGPKAWLAAQLLWAPERNPDELLEIYYREFWAEAAPAMREFFAACERTWLEKPGPPLWLRFYQDEDQSWIYSRERIAQLFGHLAAAERAATTEAVRARVGFVRAGLSVTDAYSKFCDARQALSRLARPGGAASRLVPAWREYRSARDAFVRRFSAVRAEHPLALAPQGLEYYLRNQPDSRAARELARNETGSAALRDAGDLPWMFVGATGAEIGALLTRGVECLQDPGWATVNLRPVGSSAVLEWCVDHPHWRGSGEPWEGRTVQLNAGADGRRVLRVASARTEQISQWVAATENTLYAATVKVRAKSSPGTAAHLVMSFLDENGRHMIGLGRVDRVPAGPDVQEFELCVIARAPAKVKFVGLGLRVLNQINDDFVEFSGASLKRLPPE